MSLRIAMVSFALFACSKTPEAAMPTSAPKPPTEVVTAPTPAPVTTATAPAPAVASLVVGDAAPSVTLTLHDGKSVELESLRGSRVLVYFYPKDDTPGCTIEAQGLRDRAPDLEAAGVRVFGVSVQDAESHKAFIEKYGLNFPLVVDADAKVAAAFRVPLRSNGLTSRQSFLIGKDGHVEAVWLTVDTATHAADVLAAIQ